MSVGVAGWLAFNAVILALLALDLGVFHRRAHVPRARESLRWTALWIALALAFAVFLFLRAGQEIALEYLTGYVIEESLSIDNLLVMVLVLAFFRVPPDEEHRVLFWGILGALLLRGAFIGAGTYAVHRWEWLLYGFGALLVYAGARMAVSRDNAPDLERNPVVRLTRRLIPVSGNDHEHRFLVRREGRLYATPLLLALCVIELGDVMFAVDSIPAVFAITNDPFLVFTSNVFAILGLRTMYFVLADFIRRFEYLKYGLSAILVFVGAKMLLARLVHVPTPLSLAIIAAAVGISILASAVRHADATVPNPGAESRPGGGLDAGAAGEERVAAEAD